MFDFPNLLRSIVMRLPGGRRLKTELQQLRAQRERLRARAAILQQRLASRRLDPGILQAILPVRHAALLALRDAAATGREAEFERRSTSYRERVPAPDGTGVERLVIDGLTWWVPREGLQARPARQKFQRQLPFEEIVLARGLAVGRTMIDIGANIGMTSIPRVVLGDFDRVYAAEPDNVNYGCLVRNVVDNGLQGYVMPDRVAIGDRDGEMMLEQATSGTHHLVKAGLSRGKEGDAVQCLTLDAWLARLGVNPGEIGFVKSDTQGWDGRVLAGAGAVLAQRHIVWQIEFSPSMLERAGSSAAQIYETARAHFSHFIDSRADDGRRLRRTSEMPETLRYVEAGVRKYTNLLLFNTAS